MKRPDGTNPDELRYFKITKNFVKSSDGSVLIECGSTRVICNASVEVGLPAFEGLRNWMGNRRIWNATGCHRK